MNNLLSKHLQLSIFILLSATSRTETGSADRPYQFSPCPDSPNCVSSQSADKARFIEPLQYAGSRANARKNVINILETTERVHLVKIESDYIHAEFRSLMFKFIDDVEFYLPSEESIIHVKSASRSGYYDFGANRRRVEWLRSAFKK